MMNTKRNYRNKLMVTGPEKAVRKFADKVTTVRTRISLNKLISMPVRMDIPYWNRTKKEHRKIDSWQRKNWGALGDVYDRYPRWGYHEATDTAEAKYLFDSISGVPNKWLKKVALQFPELNFKLIYDDDSWTGGDKYSYEGYLAIEHGKITKEYNKKRGIEPEPDYDSDEILNDDDEDKHKEWYELVEQRAMFKSEDDL